ncbi:hypothetical protein V6N13_029305 [Hibiscus sabdariffa]
MEAPSLPPCKNENEPDPWPTENNFSPKRTRREIETRKSSEGKRKTRRPEKQKDGGEERPAAEDKERQLAPKTQKVLGFLRSAMR